MNKTPKSQMNWKYTYIILFAVAMIFAAGNSNKVNAKVIEITAIIEDVAIVQEDTNIWANPEEWPEFPGGTKALMEFLSSNVVYPKSAFDTGIQGRVILEFFIENNGSISNIKVARGLLPVLDAEAVRVVSKMPNWTPAKFYGEPIRIKYTLPIMFRLPNPESEVQSNHINAQEILDIAIENQTDTISPIPKDSIVFQFVEQMPEFPGGTQALMDFLVRNINYPELDQETAPHGKVVIEFIVETDGSLTHQIIIRGVSKPLDDAVLDAAMKMPNWTAGKQNGKAVRVKFVLPINFRAPIPPNKESVPK